MLTEIFLKILLEEAPKIKFPNKQTVNIGIIALCKIICLVFHELDAETN